MKKLLAILILVASTLPGCLESNDFDAYFSLLNSSSTSPIDVNVTMEDVEGFLVFNGTISVVESHTEYMIIPTGKYQISFFVDDNRSISSEYLVFDDGHEPVSIEIFDDRLEQ